MARVIDGPFMAHRLDAAGVRTLVEDCMLDLDRLRHEAASVDGTGRVCAGMEERIGQAVLRLERAAAALDGIIAADGAFAQAGMLAREADHRTKNSLQAVVALLHRQARQAGADEVRQALTVAGARVAAVAQVHATLHAAMERSGLHDRIDLCEYLAGLCAALGTRSGSMATIGRCMSRWDR